MFPQIEAKRNNMFVVQPKAPQGFKDYLMVNGNYVLEGNAASRLSVPVVSNAATEILSSDWFGQGI